MPNDPQNTPVSAASLDMDQSRSALAVITYLMQHTLPPARMQTQAQPNQEVQQEHPKDQPKIEEKIPEQEPTEEKPGQPEEDKKPEEDKIGNLSKDLQELKGNMEGMINAKFDALTKTIKDALSE